MSKSEMKNGKVDLYWHCATCGFHSNEPAQPEYEHGDHEPCVLCTDGVARVMTIKEAARFEQLVALGKVPRPKVVYR